MAATVESAYFFPLDANGREEGGGLRVHFNPSSLSYTLTNTLGQPGNSEKKKQFSSQSSAKLTMQLVYDTTDSGVDVRRETEQLARFMRPQPQSNGPEPAVAVVRFSWGAFSFKGMFESYKETIEFFSADGVPLRAKLDLGLAGQDRVFEEDDAGSDTQDAVDIHPGQGMGAAGAASLAGDLGSARAIAELNGEASLRFGGSASLTVVAPDALRPPSAFASAGASAGAGAGFGAGLSAGGGIGLSAGGGFGAQAGAGLSAGGALGVQAGGGLSGAGGASVNIGGGSSAGVTASAGAFAGLRSGGSARPSRLRLDALRPPRPTAVLATDERAAFNVGGRAGSPGPGSLAAEVGVNASLQSRIQFDE